MSISSDAQKPFVDTLKARKYLSGRPLRGITPGFTLDTYTHAAMKMQIEAAGKLGWIHGTDRLKFKIGYPDMRRTTQPVP